MTRALVVESMFGNTRQVAQAVAAGLRTACEVQVVDVAAALAVPDVDLLVVGGPTHAFSMSRPTTRADAAKHGLPRSAARAARRHLTRSGSRLAAETSHR